MSVQNAAGVGNSVILKDGRGNREQYYQPYAPVGRGTVTLVPERDSVLQLVVHATRARRRIPVSSPGSISRACEDDGRPVK